MKHVRTYTVSRDKNGLYYAHKVGFPWIPIWGSFAKSRRGAQKHAAAAMALTLEEYLKNTVERK